MHCWRKKVWSSSVADNALPGITEISQVRVYVHSSSVIRSDRQSIYTFSTLTDNFLKDSANHCRHHFPMRPKFVPLVLRTNTT